MCSSMGVRPSQSPQLNSTMVWRHALSPNRVSMWARSVRLFLAVSDDTTGRTSSSVWGPGRRRAAPRWDSCRMRFGVLLTENQSQPGVSTMVTRRPDTSACLLRHSSVSWPDSKYRRPRMEFPTELFPTPFQPNKSSLNSGKTDRKKKTKKKEIRKETVWENGKPLAIKATLIDYKWVSYFL